MKTVTVNFDKLSYSGYGSGVTDDGKTVYAWNAYPGERAVVKLFSHKKEPYKGTAIEILKPSKYRISPREGHFFITSPWQTIDYKREITWKKMIVRQIWSELADVDVSGIDCVFDNYQFNYRNSIEFNIANTDNGLSIALMKRGRTEVVPVPSSALAYECVNRVALDIVGQLDSQGVDSSDIKRLIVRSNRMQEVVSCLYVTDPGFGSDFKVSLHGNLKGLQVYYSDSSVSQPVPTQLIQSHGDTQIAELVCGKILRFGVTEFFQPNIPMFEKAVQRMREYVRGKDIVDFYSGVGSIGIGLSDVINSCVLVEQSDKATEWAKRNIEENNLSSRISAVATSAQDALEYIKKDKVIIVDPPREGLHESVIDRLKQILPDRIIYLSCKPYTQVRDIRPLLEFYSLEHVELYNFFPRTPHVESLCVLERK